MKKVLSVVLAISMVLALAIPAFASSTEAEADEKTGVYGAKLEKDTEVEAPIIKVMVPAAADITVNPYKMEVDVSAAQDGSDKKQDQIINPVQYIENQSNVGIKVSASLTATPASGSKAVLATTSTQGKTSPTTKSVFLFLETEVVDSATSEPADDNWGTYDAKKTPNKVVAAAKAAAAKEVGTLAAGTGTAAASAGGFLAFRVCGDAASAPTVAWDSADVMSTSIAFTFDPVMNVVDEG